MSGGIVTGYDGSPGSEQALRWAVREARERGITLTACLTWLPDLLAPQDETMARRRGEELLTNGLRYATTLLGASRVHPVMVRGSAARALCDLSQEAELVVVGARGHGELPGLLLGSVSWQVAGYAHCPVVVVRGPWRPANRPPGPVVAGVDVAADAPAALAFAFTEAALRDVPLVAVCAQADAIGVIGGACRLEEEFEHLMDVNEKEHPEVSVTRHVVPGGPRTALLTAAACAQLLVVGARGRGGVTGMRLGSVAQGVLQYAPCPVGVVHGTGG